MQFMSRVKLQLHSLWEQCALHLSEANDSNDDHHNQPAGGDENVLAMLIQNRPCFPFACI